MIKKKILIVDDDKLIRWSVNQKLSEWDLIVVEAEDGMSGHRMAEDELPDLILLDVNLPDANGFDLLEEFKVKMPEIPIVMITAFGSVDDAVMAMKRGAYDFITKPVNYVKLQSTLNNALETVSLKKEIAYYKEREQKKFDLSHIVSASNEMKKILEMTRIVAQSETIIVLLSGESGTGKDLLAQAIHHMSRRKTDPFLAINCSAIPENLLESELFGYEKGAFTDAKQRKQGLVEIANNGSLFLDEISTLSLPLQAKLLRFLETQTFTRVGGLRELAVELRVIAATNQDLETASREGEFRKDLFYRLNVCPIHIPPLRDRPDDILPMAEHFIKAYNVKFRKNIKGMKPEVKKIFKEYPWPGNVRELKNNIERAMIFEQNSEISAQNIPMGPGGASPPSLQSSSFKRDSDFENLSLEEMERRFIISALRRAGGNKSQAARLLDVTRDTLRYKIQKLKIDP
ncbi:sigma-54-dependent transcriptional regulator [Acidobacteriota bacterium]